jgi:GTP-binding protein
MFHDEVELHLKAGKGGNGAVSFRREKFIPKGGPDGGDGGKGGDVIISTNPQLSDLNHYASIRELKAENGIAGGSQKKTGADGLNLNIEVPVGTRIFQQHKDVWIEVFDLVEDKRGKKLLTGGIGGLGNVHFATATHQTPKEAGHGLPGQTANFRFELQLIADVGIIGLPNAGKSTFLSVVSEAKPKIADYPFTTLSPVLGVVTHYDQRLIFADIPGLIEGAAQGKGLGHQFLRHIKRTKLLIHFIDALSENYANDYETILTELAVYDPKLAQKPQLVVITKGELADRNEYKAKVKALKKHIAPPVSLFKEETISAVTGQNLDKLLTAISLALKDLTAS